mgnify:CR=1 FL=1
MVSESRTDGAVAMATMTETRDRTFPAAEIEAAIRGELEQAARDQADIRGASGESSACVGYVEPEIDSLVAVAMLTRIEPLVTPIKADECLIRPGGYASVDDFVRDIVTKLERRWCKRR